MTHQCCTDGQTPVVTASGAEQELAVRGFEALCVEGSRWLGLAGIAAIVGAVVVLGLAYWRFGRR